MFTIEKKEMQSAAESGVIWTEAELIREFRELSQEEQEIVLQYAKRLVGESV